MSSSAPMREEVTIDQALVKAVGEFGSGQRWLFFLVSLAWAPGAIQTLIMTFVGLDPVQEKLWRCVNPDDEECAKAFAMDEPENAFCELGPDQWEWTSRGRSIVSDFGLTCGESWKSSLPKSGFFLGFMIGAGLFGFVSDKLGRRKALFMSCALAALGGGLCALAPSYWWYLVLRFVTGIGVAGIGLVAFVLATEPIGPNWRGFAGITTQYFFVIGECCVPLLAWLVPRWRMMTLLSAAGTASYLLLWPYIPESPRWLLVQGRKGDATAGLAAIAAHNRTHLPEAPLADVPPCVGSLTLLDVVKHPRLRLRLVVMVYGWFAVCLIYYGLSLALESLSGDIYLNFFLLSIAEAPAYATAAVTVDRLGRKATFTSAFLLGGVCCCLCTFTSGQLQQVLALLGKFGTAGAFNVAFLYTCELFPTVVRNAVLGSSSLSARVGGIIAPPVATLGKVTFLIFGSLALGAGCLSMLLPETLGLPLPETLGDVGTGGRKVHEVQVQDGEAPESDGGLVDISSSTRTFGNSLGRFLGRPQPRAGGFQRISMNGEDAQ